MAGCIQRFQIIGLYGSRTYDIKINDNTLVLVGENGMGKTTVLKFLFGVLSGAISDMPQYNFDKIVVTIDDTDYELSYDDTLKARKVPISIIRELPPPVRKELLELQNDNNDDFVEINDIITACQMAEFPYQRIFELINDNKVSTDTELAKKVNEIKNTLNSQVLYLPTYRRIEDDLSRILKGRWYTPNSRNRLIMNRKTESNDYIEFVEFGMQDVKEKIALKSEELSRFSEMSFKNLTYMNLGDVVDRKYEISHDQFINITEDDIKKFELCSSRISSSVLSQEQFQKIIDTIVNIKSDNYDTHSKILLYSFRKLIELQSELEEKEQSIRDFCKVCKNYLVDKSVYYNDSTFKVSVTREKNNATEIIDMSHLSSGEKQIVSLFSHLYLSNQAKKFFVLIDEPELSLSVPWQKRFLEDIRNSNLCSGLIAVTHSPFIYDNSLMQFAHGLGEFITEYEVLSNVHD